jgi:hypothetical protein
VRCCETSALGDDLGGLDHRHVEVRPLLDQPGVLRPELVALVVLDQRDRLEAAAHRDRHAVMHDLFRRGGDRHQPGGALAIDRHPGDRDRQSGADRRLTGHIVAGRSLLERSAEHDVLDLGRIDPGAAHCFGDDVAGERLPLRVVERAAIGAADRGAGGRYDDGCRQLVLPEPRSLRHKTR